MPDLIQALVLVALAGAGAGFLSGLLGIGGGFIVVPALFLLAAPLGIEADLAMHMALGTSLAAMIATTARSARAHGARGAVDAEVLRRLAPFVLVGAILGASFAASLKGPILTGIFATAALGLSIRTYLGRDPKADPNRRDPATWIVGAGAMAVGAASAIVGIGGAAFGAPLLARLGLDFRKVIGTAAWIGVMVAVPSAMIYALSGQDLVGRPPYSLGYVNLPGALLIVVTTWLTTSLGVRLNARLSPLILRRTFAVFLFLTAARMFYALI